jgi:reverse gyrase
MEVVYGICCGLDVQARSVVACLIRQGRKQTRTFGAMTGDLLELRDWLVSEGCTHVEVKPEGHETQPPPRFNEASLVKFLEENGIGRPSTYAEIIRKIEDREYVRKRDRRFQPTLLGRLVVDLIREGVRRLLPDRVHREDGGTA